MSLLTTAQSSEHSVGTPPFVAQVLPAPPSPVPSGQQTRSMASALASNSSQLHCCFPESVQWPITTSNASTYRVVGSTHPSDKNNTQRPHASQARTRLQLTELRPPVSASLARGAVAHHKRDPIQLPVVAGGVLALEVHTRALRSHAIYHHTVYAKRHKQRQHCVSTYPTL